MSKQPTKNQNSWEVDFVRCELSKSERDDVQKWDKDGVQTWDTVTRLVEDGYKLSVSADKQHNCVGAYLTSPKTQDGKRQKCLGSRGPDILGALRSLAFKHVVKLDQDWANGTSADWDTGSWG